MKGNLCVSMRMLNAIEEVHICLKAALEIPEWRSRPRCAAPKDFC